MQKIKEKMKKVQEERKKEITEKLSSLYIKLMESKKFPNEDQIIKDILVIRDDFQKIICDYENKKVPTYVLEEHEKFRKRIAIRRYLQAKNLKKDSSIGVYEDMARNELLEIFGSDKARTITNDLDNIDTKNPESNVGGIKVLDIQAYLKEEKEEFLFRDILNSKEIEDINKFLDKEIPESIFKQSLHSISTRKVRRTIPETDTSYMLSGGTVYTFEKEIIQDISRVDKGIIDHDTILHSLARLCVLTREDVSEKVGNKNLESISGALDEAFDEILDKLSKRDLKEILNKQNQNGDTIFHILAKIQNIGFEEVLKELSKDDIKEILNKQNQNGDTILHVLAKTDIEALDEVLKELSKDDLKEIINKQNQNGDTILHIAIKSWNSGTYNNNTDVVAKNIEVMKRLITAGADYTIKNNDSIFGGKSTRFGGKSARGLLRSWIDKTKNKEVKKILEDYLNNLRTPEQKNQKAVKGKTNRGLQHDRASL